MSRRRWRPLVVFVLVLAALFYGVPAVYYWTRGETMVAANESLLALICLAAAVDVWTQ